MHFTTILAHALALAPLIKTGLAADYNVREQWEWIDKSCDDLIDRLNQAGEDYTALVDAAVDLLEEGIDLTKPENELKDRTVQVYLGNHDPGARLIRKKFLDLQKYTNGKPIPLSLYCDASAFEWVTEYQEGDKKGESLEGEFKDGGAWHSKEGRYNPERGPLYLDGSPKSDKRIDYCHTPEGKRASGVSAKKGTHIMLCPPAFTLAERMDPESEPEVGTKLDDLLSTGGVLLHEMTHAELGTADLPKGYGAIACMVLSALKRGAGLQNNADSWMNFAMAALMKKRAWVTGFAQPTDNWGIKGPKP